MLPSSSCLFDQVIQGSSRLFQNSDGTITVTSCNGATASLPTATVSTGAAAVGTTTALIKGEYITIKNPEPDVVVKEELEENEDEEEEMDILNQNLNDPSLADISFHVS